MDSNVFYRLLYVGSDDEIFSAIHQTTKDADTHRIVSIDLSTLQLYQAIEARRSNVVEFLLHMSDNVGLLTTTYRDYYPLHLIAITPDIYNIMKLLCVDKKTATYFKKYLHVIKEMKLKRSTAIVLLRSILYGNKNFTECDLLTLCERTKKEELQIARLLIECGALVNAANRLGYTALHLSAKEGNADMVKLLLIHGANITLKTYNGNTALKYARLAKHDNVIKTIVDHYKTYTKSNIPLINAVCDLDLEMISFLIDIGVDINEKDRHWKTPLHYATDINKLELVRLFLENSMLSESDNFLSGSKVSFLKENRNASSITLKIIKLLLLHGAKVNSKDKFRKTPLHYATKMPYTTDIVKVLIDKGADVNARDKYRKTPLINATDMPHFSDLLKIIIDYGVNVRSQEAYIKTSLSNTVKKIHYKGAEVAKILIDSGADINIQDIYGTTPLYNATKTSAMTDVAKILISRGANIDITYRHGITLLHNASSLIDGTELVRTILSLGVDVNARENSGNTALHYASSVKGGIETIKLLLNYGASVQVRNKFGRTPLYNAASISDGSKIVKMLIESGASANIRDIYGKTPLHYATNVARSLETIKVLTDNGFNTSNSDIVLQSKQKTNKESETIKMLVMLGANINAEDISGKTPLHQAAIVSRYIEPIQMLIAMGADVNAKDVSGKTPLHHASSVSHDPEVIKTFIHFGANVNDKDVSGKTPLHYAVILSQGYSTIQTLIAFGASINMKDIYGKTPLHYAAAVLRSTETVKVLIDNECDINAVDAYGKTALHYATNSYFNIDMIRVLIEGGANVNARDMYNNTPIYSSFHTPEIVKLLLEYGAEVNTINDNGMTPLEEAVIESIHSAELIVLHIILEAFRFPEISNNLIFIQNMEVMECTELKGMKVSCEKELNKMKHKRLTSKYALDIFLRSKNKNLLARLVKNVKPRYLKSSLFPIYITDLRKSVYAAMQRSELLTNFMINMDKAIDTGYWTLLPIEIKQQILSLLDDDNLSGISKHDNQYVFS